MKGPEPPLTKQVTGEVDRQDDADRQNAHHYQQPNDVALKGQVMHRILTTLLPDLIIPTARTRPTVR